MKLEIEVSDKYTEDEVFSRVYQAIVAHYVQKFDTEMVKVIREEFSLELRKKARETFGKLLEEEKFGEYSFKDYLTAMLMRPGHGYQKDKPRLHQLLEDIVLNRAQRLFQEIFESKIEDIKKDLAARVGELVISRLR